MDKWGALDTFWNSFGLPAYDARTIPDTATMPYITYEAGVASLDEPIPLTANLWYHSTRWAEICQMSDTIEEAIGGGYGVRYDNGRMWVTKASAFAQKLADSDNPQTRRIVLQVKVEFQ